MSKDLNNVNSYLKRIGRISLTDDHFRVVANEQVAETKLSSDAEFNELLKKHFALDRI